MAETPEPQDEESLQYWGYLFKEDKCGTDLLHRLLTGIAGFICTSFEPSGCPDITPSQLAAFYRSVGGNYDTLFLETHHSSIAFIYKSLGCLHSLQPSPSDDGYGTPSIPALKTKGFITWQTIQLLLGPEQHVPFLQAAVSTLDILDPASSTPFPKTLPREAFPAKPDPDMTQWYEDVSERLRQEAQADSQHPGPDSSSEAGRNHHRHTHASSTDYESTSAADGRQGAAQYFSNPLYRDRDGRPAIVRPFSRQPLPRSPRGVSGYIQERIGGVRHLWSPHYGHGQAHSGRRGSLPERRSGQMSGSANAEDNAHTTRIPSTFLHPRYVPARRPSHQRERGPASSSTSSSDAESGETPSQRRDNSGSGSTRNPPLRHRKSDSPPRSPRAWTPPQSSHGYGRRQSTQAHMQSPAQTPSPVPSSQAGFGPSGAPLFATHVAHFQPTSRGHNERGQLAQRGGDWSGSHRIPGVRYMDRLARNARDSTYGAGSERERERFRDLGEGQIHRYVVPQTHGVGGRKYSVESSWR